MKTIQIISAASILGLKPGGVERLGESLLAAGLADRLQNTNPVIHVPTNNSQYSFERDKETQCLNALQIVDFSVLLFAQLSNELNTGNFPLVLGGDCSILLGIMPAMKKHGRFGLIFLDAHADFYEPDKSPTGEVADMDLAIVTGYGPTLLSNIYGLQPYVKEEDVIHVGQRDAEETSKYGSQDIANTSIKRFDIKYITSIGLQKFVEKLLACVHSLNVDGFWLHFDTDVLNDEENPAVDYRLPGGLTFGQAEHIIHNLLMTDKIAGVSVTIFNPDLDSGGVVAEKITSCLSTAARRH